MLFVSNKLTLNSFFSVNCILQLTTQVLIRSLGDLECIAAQNSFNDMVIMWSIQTLKQIERYTQFVFYNSRYFKSIGVIFHIFIL